MTTRKLDATAALRRLAEIRKRMPFLENTPRRGGDGRLTNCRTAEDFEAEALAEGLQNLADDLSAAFQKKEAEALETALRVYYTAEELARDPANAHIVPHVERMREPFPPQLGSRPCRQQ
jgi:hypothetical protein